MFAVSVMAAAQTSPPAPAALTLDQAVQEAIANNLDLAAEKLNVSVAEARGITARLRPNPVLTVSGQSLNILGATYSPATPLGPNQMNIHTDFPLERGHKREQRIAVANEEKSLAELGVREVMRQVIASVQSAFVDVQQAKENLSLAQENLRSLESVVAINESRLKAGDLAQVELDRSRVAALQYRTAVQQAQLQLDQSKIQLQQVMGRKAKTTDMEVAGTLRRDVIADSQEELNRLALTRRPDYLSDQQSQARSRADLRLQLANGKVDYTIGTEFTRQSAWGISGNSVGLYFSMPLRVFNKNQGEIARAQREIILAGARANALESSIQTEVDKAYRQYVVSRQLLTNVETEMLAKARSVRDTTEYSYKRGEASLVEYLDAQRAFNDAMQTANDARANYARSLYLIDTVSGATVSGS
ncbi:cellobiose phosphorylase [Bryobacterales bacterium F-183]|nr:cellobiose phosphorylase [Bryobacterales bacterium F-183]